MPPRAALAALAALLAARAASAAFSVLGGVTQQAFLALVAGDGTPAGSPVASPNTVAATVIEFQLSYAPATGFVSVQQNQNTATLPSNGVPTANPYQLSILGDYADRGTASGAVRPDGTACWTMSASTPTLACQGVPLGGTISMTADNKFVTLAGYDLPAGTRIVAPENVASTMQNLSLPAASVNRVLASVDLSSGAASVVVNVNAYMTAAVASSVTRVPYPVEITGATFWRNESDPSGNTGTWFATSGWGSATAGTTQTVFVPMASGLSARRINGGLVASVLTTGLGLPSSGGLVSLPVTAGITSPMANTGTGNVVQYGAGGSQYYTKHLHAARIYNGYLYYALNSKGINVCLSGIPRPGASCNSLLVAQFTNAYAYTGGPIDARDFVFTGLDQLWVLDSNAGLAFFNMPHFVTNPAPSAGPGLAPAAGAAVGMQYITMPPNAYRWPLDTNGLNGNASVVGLAVVQVQNPLTTFIMVAQPDQVWAWPAANNGAFVDTIGNCCGPANRGTAGASCCWANGNQPVAFAPANTRFRSLTSPNLIYTSPSGSAPSAAPTASTSVSPSVTPTLSVTSSETPSQTSTISASPTPSTSESGSPSVSPTPSPTPTPTASLSSGASISRTPSISETSSITPTMTRTPSNTPTSSRTPTTTISITPSQTPSKTPSSSTTPTPSNSKGAAAPVPLLLKWTVSLHFGGPTASTLTPAQLGMMTPSIVCDSRVRSALTGGFAALLQLPGSRAVTIVSTTDTVTGAVATTCSRRARALERRGGGGGLVGAVGRMLGRAAEPAAAARARARELQGAGNVNVAMQALFGGSLSKKDQQAALLAVTGFSQTGPTFRGIAEAMAIFVGTNASSFAITLDAATVDLSPLGSDGPVVVTATSTAQTATVGGVLGGICGAILAFSGFATLRYYMMKGRLPPIFGKSTKTAAQKRDARSVRRENDELKANPLAQVKLSREDSAVAAGLIGDMTPEELEEMKQMKLKKREAARARKAAEKEEAASKGGASPAGASSPPRESFSPMSAGSPASVDARINMA